MQLSGRDCWVELTQLAATQTAPAGWNAHDRLPEHCPLRPQVDTGWAAHSSAGSAPAASGLQMPGCPAWLHFSQTPPQRASQQTWSVQKPLEQAPSTAQGWPSPIVQDAPVLGLSAESVPRLPPQTFLARTR